MNIITKIIEFLKKIGILKVGTSSSSFKSSKDAGYQPPDPLDD
jgi:hypothetical protein